MLTPNEQAELNARLTRKPMVDDHDRQAERDAGAMRRIRQYVPSHRRTYERHPLDVLVATVARKAA